MAFQKEARVAGPGGRRSLRRWVPLVGTALWTCLIWGNSLQPATVSGAQSGAATAFFAQWLPWLTDHIIRKTAHFAEYGVLGTLLACVLHVTLRGPRRDLFLTLFAGLAIPLSDETIQLFVPGRSGEVRDVLLDFSGVLCGLAFGCLLFYLARKRRRAASDR